MKKKIMIVDDDQDQLLTIRIALEKLDIDYDVITANGGKPCLEILKNYEIPDIILLDIMMPEMSGWEVFHILRENTSWMNIPIVFLTARSDKIAKNAGELLGDDYIEKPVEIKELKIRIDGILEKNSM